MLLSRHLINLKVSTKICYTLQLTQLEKLNLTRELAELKTQPQDINNRGNSLFAEVEDRRVLAEKKLIRYVIFLICVMCND